MPRTKDGKITKPTGESQARRRGRPAIDWTPSRKRRLLRLYLCTPESGLSLKEILELLAEGSFQPKPRHTQCLLNELLSKSYRQRRPKNRASMERRLAYLRSMRDGRPVSNPPKGDEIDCAILLAKNPSEWRQQSPVSNCPTNTLGREMTRLSISHHLGLEQASASDLSSIRPGSSTAGSFDSPEMSAPELPGSTGRIFKHSSKTIKERRCSRGESLRVKLPGRTSSFLADVVSLLSGLSICSSSTGVSSSCASPTWNQRSFLSRSNSSATLYEGRGKRRSTIPMPMPMGKAMSPEDPIDYSDKYVQNADSRANQELLQHCCSKKAWCIHKRISAVCFGNRSPDTFVCAEQEVNDQDGLGNTALHVAARWIAPGPVLFRIMMKATTTTLNTPNHLNELFLHVLNPRSLDMTELAHFTKYLVGREFNFCHLDSSGMTFVERLLARPDFTIEALEAIFSYLPEATRLFLLRQPSSPNLNPLHMTQTQPPLIQAIRARLNVIEGNSLIPDPSQLEAASSYCDYFLARYGTAYRTVWIKPPSIFAHVPVDPQGRNNLHQIVASMNVGRNMCPPTAENLCYYTSPTASSPVPPPSLSDTSFLDLDLDLDLDVAEPTSIMASNPLVHPQSSPVASTTSIMTSTTTALTFPQLLALVLSPTDPVAIPEDPNNRSLPHFRTPLMTLIRQFAWGNFSHYPNPPYARPSDMLVECLHLLLAHGAQPELVDIDGNNALHHAAELGLLSAVVVLCNHDADLQRMVNRVGQTPLDVAIQRMSVKGYMPVTTTEGGSSSRVVGRHAEVVLFLETGVVMGDE
ncbi:hypothetical protein B0T20DRAFT_42842 [Sordaria brevicollis]|uniref:Ankyrin repeat protein n=1 Tax=Sordaria brevicollis TaxID=83679 RepID=A0AAE0P988_SORBR|nr:hypothetical protein B0T20DRAFT_42842 [Sordaria brevicollis]